VKALVTGGAGFIGSALTDRLLAEAHTVDVVDDLSTGSLANLASARAGGARRLSFQQLDIRSPALAGLLERRRPEVVFHLAAAPAADGSFADPAADAETDIVGTLRLLEACRRHRVGKVVFASSAAIYGEPDARDLPVRESRAVASPGPWTPRGAAKRAVGEYLQVYRERYALEFSVLALANVYGPGQDPQRRAGVVGTFARRLLAGEECVIDGDGRQTRDFVYIDDAVDALARAGTRGGGLLINVATGVETSINALHGLMAAAVTAHGALHPAAGDADVDAVADPRPATHGPARPVEPRRLALDPSRAGIHLGWSPWTALADGVDATLAWWRDRTA